MVKNPVVLWELASNNADASVEFFKKVFDWDFNFDEEFKIYDTPAGDLSKNFSGGIVFTLKEAKLPFLTVYLMVDDIEAKAKLIEENGGYIELPPAYMPSGAFICLFNEPSGVTFAMIEKKKK